MFIDLAGSLYDWSRVVCVEYAENQVRVKMRNGLTHVRQCTELDFYRLTDRAASLGALSGRFHVFPISAITAIESDVDTSGYTSKYTLEDGSDITMGLMTAAEHAHEMSLLYARL